MRRIVETFPRRGSHRAPHTNHVWSYEFLTERTEDGRQLRILVVIDECTSSLPGWMIRPPGIGGGAVEGRQVGRDLGRVLGGQIEFSASARSVYVASGSLEHPEAMVVAATHTAALSRKGRLVTTLRREY